LLTPGGVTQQRIAFGKTGEDLAVSELEQRGYAIVARRWRSRAGEIDIIARDGDTLVFVEVKAREDHDFGDAAEAVTIRKRRTIVRVAKEYVVEQGWIDRPCRFDVVTIHLEAGGPVVAVYANAFDERGLA
jgi:putative endonuclease